jgi:hypothetical protein
MRLSRGFLSDAAPPNQSKGPQLGPFALVCRGDEHRNRGRNGRGMSPHSQMSLRTSGWLANPSALQGARWPGAKRRGFPPLRTSSVVA